MSRVRSRVPAAPAPCPAAAGLGPWHGVHHAAGVRSGPRARRGAGPPAGRAVLQPARAGGGRQPGGDRPRLPGRDAGEPAEHPRWRVVPHRRARGSWRPSQGTIVYEAFTGTRAAPAPVRLSDTRRLDARGGWEGGRPGGAETLQLGLVSEAGQWRIDNPPDALVVPTSYFEPYASPGSTCTSSTRPDGCCCPTRCSSRAVTRPPTNLVRGLLAGPGGAPRRVTPRGPPARTTLDLSVVVTESGIAEVPLPRACSSWARRSCRAVDQLARTLRQVPGIERVRVTVAGAPVPLPDGRHRRAGSRARERDAAGADCGAVGAAGRTGGRPRSSSGSPAPGPLGRARLLAAQPGGPRRPAAAGRGVRQRPESSSRPRTAVRPASARS